MMLLVRVIQMAGFISCLRASNLDGCPAPDPNCHPSCVVYDASHCRLCRCPSDHNFGDSSWESGGSVAGGTTDAAWDRGFNGDWSDKVSEANAWGNDDTGSSTWGNTGSSHSSGSKETTEVRYVLVEKESELYPMAPQVPSSPFGGGARSSMSIPPMSRSSAFLALPSLRTGPSQIGENSASVIHVPLIAPGQPRYCVRCHILSCPSTCERVDEYGCHSCPCAPSRFQAMPVMNDCSDGPGSSLEVVERKPDCRATKLCIATCKDGYKLGAAGRDGCRECTCIRTAPTTPKPQEKGCPGTISCMLKCKDGYVLGDKQRDGCPSCRCLAKGVNMGAGNKNTGSENGFGKENSGKSSWATDGSSNWNSNNGAMSGNKDSSYNLLSSSNGVGKGECKPPVCLDGHVSVDQAMKMGTDSANGRYTSGMTSSMTSGGSVGGTSGEKDKNCFPMCAGGSNSQFMGNSENTMGTGSTGSGSGGCSGPFCATMNGMGSGGGGMGGGGGGMGMKGGTGNGRPFSPFAAAMSGTGPGMGMSGGMPRSSSGTHSAVADAAYNKDCLGPACSAKNGMQHKECPNLIHCLVTCDGQPLLGDLDQNGCQTCTCA